MRKTFILMLALAGIGTLAGFMAVSGLPAPADRTALRPVWTETKWPFLLDQWGIGKAFVCAPADCGAEIDVYVRPKIGFCNCSTGVSDDNELDRLSDFNLMGDKPSVLGPGHEINIAWMKGRSRAYAVAEPYHAPGSALAIAFNDRCDAIVATATVAHDPPTAIEPSVIDFLNSEVIVHWAEVTLGL